MGNNCCSFNCPVDATIQLIGGKYKAVILWHLMNKTLRYSEIHKLIPKATDKMLAQQLRELEKDGLINREVYPVVPPKTEYSLIEFGKTLTPILDELCNWGGKLFTPTLIVGRDNLILRCELLPTPAMTARQWESRMKRPLS